MNCTRCSRRLISDSDEQEATSRSAFVQERVGRDSANDSGGAARHQQPSRAILILLMISFAHLTSAFLFIALPGHVEFTCDIAGSDINFAAFSGLT